MNFPSSAVEMHYCDIFSDCFHCPVPFCPCEKLEDGTDAGWADIDEVMYEDDDEKGGDPNG